MAPNGELEGRTILVAGVLKGAIGGATVRQLAEAGADIVAVDHRQDIVDDAVSLAEAAGARCRGIVTDLMDPAGRAELIEIAAASFGRLDGIANIAGGTLGLEAPLEETTLESFRKTIAINLEYVFELCRDAARWMIANGSFGSLVNIGSVSAISAAPDHGPYGAAKSAVAALTRTMAFEWGRYGIRANTVSPGAVYTQRNAAGFDPQADRASEVAWTSIDELAAAVVFLLTDAASGISGQNITVDSGLSTKFCAGFRPFSVRKARPVL